MIEQAFIDMADLFHAERAEQIRRVSGRPTAGHLNPQILEGIEQMEDDPVVYRQRLVAVVRQVLPDGRPSRNGYRSGSNSDPP